jgi:hypothetical protein
MSTGRRRRPTGTTAQQVRGLLHMAATSPPHLAASAAEVLGEIDARLISPEAEHLLLETLRDVWSRGWQPVEVQREARRSGTVAQSRLVVVLVDAERAAHPVPEVDPRWVAQLDQLGARGTTGPAGWVARWRADCDLDHTDFVEELTGLLCLLVRLPTIEVLIPPPGASDAVITLTGLGPDLDHPVLAKVRALLAQAESTTFEAEAEAFTAKAQGLMAQHAIDAARLASTRGIDERPVTIRLPVDEPYVDPKSLLLQIVAKHNRCRAVHWERIALSTVVGFASDVTSVEVLFTSLLVQAQTAMAEAARTAPPGARTRSRGYRSTFLRAYAHRVGERLAEINAGVLAEAEAEHGSALVPVLEARSEAVDRLAEELFPDLKTSRYRGNLDPAGWVGGRQAADMAKLNAAELGA